MNKNTFEKMSVPDLYVQFKDRRLTRQQLCNRISSYPPPSVTLTGYDVSVVTVAPNGDDWVAIILEELEFERKGADAKGEKEYAAWVTRDGRRKLSSNKWVILFSDEVGQERWKGRLRLSRTGSRAGR